ncbi:MAG TPA: RsmB/NOP family class I SAM-dependent RNA methyltransferase [Candidatus Bathyarchaeia archaeon]|nr:RsmB/NOP family class I SAM-dependent RNA methyltransferase [Candidatus Bathyarchaeia archaeon]
MTVEDLAGILGPASRALELIERGFSERMAVQIAVTDSRKRQDALELVLDTVSQKDSLTKALDAVLGQRRFSQKERMFLTMVCHLILTSSTAILERSVRAIREETPLGIAREVEKLIGEIRGATKNGVALGETDEEQVAIRTHQQVWWAKYCFRLLGRSAAIDFLSSSDRPRFVHVNPLKNSGSWTLPEEKRPDLGHALIKALPDCDVYRLGASPFVLSKYFAEGLFQLQDLASFLAVMVADPRPHERVLELCAAPGSKTSTIAQKMMNLGQIVSVDMSSTRLRMWRHHIDRMGVRIAEPVLADASNLGINDGFDLVIVDPPCSGTGVFDRNPRMKWYVSPRSVEKYSTIQQAFLDQAVSLVGGQGRIVYSTCSITTEENEGVISSFLANHAEFETRPTLSYLGSPGRGSLTNCRRFYPHSDHTAGYFIAKMQRT